MLATVVDAVSWVFILIGCLFLVSGAVGLVRLPDVYTRLHAASVTDTGGTIFLSIGLLLEAIFVFRDPFASIKVVLVLFFTLFTTPTASHVLAKTALLTGLSPKAADGTPLVESAEAASLLARSRRDDT